MLLGPDWNKLYANGQCLYYGVPFSDKQWEELGAAKNEADKQELIRKWREEYLKNIDVVTGKKVEKPAVEETTDEVEESIEEVKPTKKKGK